PGGDAGPRRRRRGVAARHRLHALLRLPARPDRPVPLLDLPALTGCVGDRGGWVGSMAWWGRHFCLPHQAMLPTHPPVRPEVRGRTEHPFFCSHEPLMPPLLDFGRIFITRSLTASAKG